MLTFNNVFHTASLCKVCSQGTCTGSGFGVFGLSCQCLANMGKVERRLCVHGFCLKSSKQAVVSNDSHMSPRWNKNSNFVFTYLDISTGLQVMSTWECSFSSPLHCLQNLIFINHGVMLYHTQARITLRTCSLTVEFLCQKCSELSGASTEHLSLECWGTSASNIEITNKISTSLERAFIFK